MTLSLPKIIGHRGACAYAPENTLSSIYTAHDLGLEWVELDVKLTKDMVPIIFHDGTLDRTTSGSGRVIDTNYEDIKELEAGSWFGESFIGEPIPSLEQVIEVLCELDMSLNLEIKPCPSRERETAEAALDLLAGYWEEHERILLSSFQIQSLEVCQEMAPEWARGLLFKDDFPENWQQIADHLAPRTLHIDGNKIQESPLAAFVDYGKPVLAYTINDESQAEWLFERGVKTIFSDMPDIF
jgi:glycerophosphoryl diester phosphodiesterase